MTADQIIKTLKMLPHPIEGGYYAETYRSAASLPQSVLPSLAGSPYPAERSLATAIYYLITADTFSAMHRVRGDEMFHFYLGDPVEMLQLYPDDYADYDSAHPDSLIAQYAEFRDQITARTVPPNSGPSHL